MDEEFAKQVKTLLLGCSARLLVLEAALQEAVRLQPEALRGPFAVALRARVAHLMQERVDVLNPTTDSAMTAALAALLEAAGEPRSRPGES